VSTADQSALKFRNHLPLYVSMRSPSHAESRQARPSARIPLRECCSSGRRHQHALLRMRSRDRLTDCHCYSPLWNLDTRPHEPRGRVFPIRSPCPSSPPLAPCKTAPELGGRIWGRHSAPGGNGAVAARWGANQAPAEPMVPSKVSWPNASNYIGIFSYVLIRSNRSRRQCLALLIGGFY
jgi:hypothetical protein